MVFWSHGLKDEDEAADDLAALAEEDERVSEVKIESRVVVGGEKDEPGESGGRCFGGPPTRPAR